MAEKEGKKDFFDYVRPFTVKYVKPIVDWVFQSKFHAAMTILGFIVLIILLKLTLDIIRPVVIISFLILIGGISKIYQRYFKVQVGIEFIMLSTILCGYVYGPIVGGFVGFATFALATVISGRVSHTLVISFVLIILIGMASFLFRNTTIRFAGITLTIIYNMILVPVYIGWFRGRIPRIFLFSITHILWNIWVFSAIAPSLLSIIQ